MTDNNIKISVVVITFNEERNIRRCLESVEGIADDITVVDSYSTDATVDICKEMGASVYSQKFLGHLEQKNFANTKARYPHILSLDADEALDDTLKKAILEVKSNWNSEGYVMNRLTNYCGKWIRHCGWYPDRKLRLWDSREGEWKGVNPHDEYMLKPGAKSKLLPGDILHYSYHSIADHIKQVNYFTDIAAKANLLKGKKSSLLHVTINPFVKFIRDYIFLGGFRDGYYGFIICLISSHATFLKYAKMRQLSSSNLDDAYSS
jgi:glycosyltransferase involved in cell wall biosynthesis